MALRKKPSGQKPRVAKKSQAVKPRFFARVSARARRLVATKKRIAVTAALALSLGLGTVAAKKYFFPRAQPVAMQISPQTKVSFWFGFHEKESDWHSLRQLLDQKLQNGQKVHALAIEAASSTAQEQLETRLAFDEDRALVRQWRSQGVPEKNIESYLWKRFRSSTQPSSFPEFTGNLAVYATLHNIPLKQIELYSADERVQLAQWEKESGENGKLAVKQPSFLDGIPFARKAVDAQRKLLFLRNQRMQQGLEQLTVHLQKEHPGEKVEIVTAFGGMHKHLFSNWTGSKTAEMQFEKRPDLLMWAPLLEAPSLAKPFDDLTVARTLLCVVAMNSPVFSEKAVVGARKATWADFVEISKQTTVQHPDRLNKTIHLLEQIAMRK